MLQASNAAGLSACGKVVLEVLASLIAADQTLCSVMMIAVSSGLCWLRGCAPGFQRLQVLQKAVAATLLGLQLGQASAACPHDVPTLVPEPCLHRLLRPQQLLHIEPQVDYTRLEQSQVKGLSSTGAHSLLA